MVGVAKLYRDEPVFQYQVSFTYQYFGKITDIDKIELPDFDEIDSEGNFTYLYKGWRCVDGYMGEIEQLNYFDDEE